MPLTAMFAINGLT